MSTTKLVVSGNPTLIATQQKDYKSDIQVSLGSAAAAWGLSRILIGDEDVNLAVFGSLSQSSAIAVLTGIGTYISQNTWEWMQKNILDKAQMNWLSRLAKPITTGSAAYGLSLLLADRSTPSITAFAEFVGIAGGSQLISEYITNMLNKV
jgi:hypothetical protein